ncbi:chitinase [Kribbella sp. NPDC056861]|uniref:chitinase n=1 Tax=Kribbella sp. NPDC056861 TaxID=3154857 RepID=UPI0034252F9B
MRRLITAITSAALAALIFLPSPVAEAHHRPDLPLTEAQFEQMFPNRLPFYTYQGLVDVLRTYPRFANTGSRSTQKREIAAFLAQVDHESGQLRYLINQNPASWPVFCDRTQSYGCPAGPTAYHGRGPIMLSWNFNYKNAGDAIGKDLLNHPELVETDPAVAWTTAVWYWMTQKGGAKLTSHQAMLSRAGFGGTIRAINYPECDGGNPAAMQHRVEAFKRFAHILHVSPGRNLTC